jgi:putative hydrolase of the HAD superfamily
MRKRSKPLRTAASTHKGPRASQSKAGGADGVEALLFDFGGTLAFLDYDLLADEFSRDGLDITALALEHAEYAGRAAIDRNLMGGGVPSAGSYEDYWRAWMRAAGVPEERFGDYRSRFQAIHRQQTLWRVVRPGIRETLARLRDAGFKTAIVSNAEGQVAGDAERFGLAEFFDTIIDSHVVGVAKPDPRIFQIALERLGVAPEQARFAGDIYSIDVLGARAAGIEAALIDQHGRYDWVEHRRIRHVRELHPLD